MSSSSDFLHEMPGDPQRSDIPASFAEEVRFAVSGPPPPPSPALAAVLAAGFSHPSEKGDLLVTAASNVHGPAPQAAGLPKWRRERQMHASGFATGWLAKLASLGTTAKAAMAGATAVATMGLAGGAAGALPAPVQHLVATAVNATTPFQFPSADTVTGTVEHTLPTLPSVDVPPPSVPAVSASASASSAASTSASASASVKPPATPTLPAVPAASGVVPALPSVTAPVAGLVKNLPACVANLVPANGATPNPATLASQIPSCIQQVLASTGLPVDVATCISSVLGTIGGVNGMITGSVPSVGSLNVSSCVPVDATKCVSSMLSMLGTLPGVSGGGLPGLSGFSGLSGGALPGLPAGSIPGLSGVTGCVPMNITTCLNSITTALATLPTTGGTPKLDLSACMPTAAAGTTSGIPGIGSIPGLSGLPGLSGALPFFGK